MKGIPNMRSATMPKEQFEKDMQEIEVSRAKYAGQFDNPEELEKSANALASYVKNHRMRY